MGSFFNIFLTLLFYFCPFLNVESVFRRLGWIFCQFLTQKLVYGLGQGPHSSFFLYRIFFLFYFILFYSILFFLEKKDDFPIMKRFRPRFLKGTNTVYNFFFSTNLIQGQDNLIGNKYSSTKIKCTNGLIFKLYFINFSLYYLVNQPEANRNDIRFYPVSSTAKLSGSIRENIISKIF